MSIISKEYTMTNSTVQFAEGSIEIKEFLKTAGWTVVGSSDGSTGNMDYDDGATDRIGTDTANLTDANSWFVLESPHAAQEDKVQILFSKDDASNYTGELWYNPYADNVNRFQSSDTTIPTATYAFQSIQDPYENGSYIARMHMLVDNEYPYGFTVYTHIGRFSSSAKYFSIGFFPLENVSSLFNGKPYIFYCDRSNDAFEDSSFISNSTNPTQGTIIAEPHSVPGTPILTNALNYNSFVPNGFSAIDGYYQSFPISFYNYNGFVGSSDFVRWNGVSLYQLTTLSYNGNTRDRIVFGDVNLPWDGYTIPIF